MDVKANEASLIKDNPLLLPLNKEKTVYDGFITVQASQDVGDALCDTDSLVLYLPL